MAPSVGRTPGNARAGLVINPVALQRATGICPGHDPAGALQPAVIVRQIDVARGRVGPLAPNDGARPSCIGLPACLGGGDERIGHRSPVLKPIALQVARGIVAGHEPAALEEPPVVVRIDLVPGIVMARPAQHVAAIRGEVRPPLGRGARLAGVALRVNPVALQALAIGVCYDPAGTFESAIVVCEVDVPRRWIGPPAANNRAVWPSVAIASVRRADQLFRRQPSIGMQPVALEATRPAVRTLGDNEPASRLGAISPVIDVAVALAVPSGGDARLRIGLRRLGRERHR